MLPRWHIILGAIFSLVLWYIAPKVEWYNIIIVFLASFLIDFDHYLSAAIKDKSNLNLFNSFKYYEKQGKEEISQRNKGIRKVGDFHLFHTAEFHIFVFILGLFFPFFMFVFIGMLFHSIIDIYDLMKTDFMYRREFFLFNWIKNKLRN